MSASSAHVVHVVWSQKKTPHLILGQVLVAIAPFGEVIVVCVRALTEICGFLDGSGVLDTGATV